MRRIPTQTLFAFGIGCLLTVISTLLLFDRVDAQNDTIADLKARLTDQKVPLKSINIKNRIPFQIEVVLQSASDGRVVAPDDPLYQHTVQREKALALRRGINVNSVRVLILDKGGNLIYWSEVPVNQALREKPNLHSQLTDAAIVEIIRSQIPTNGLSVNQLQVSPIGADGRVVNVELLAPSIEVANHAVGNYTVSLPLLLERLNADQGAQIAILKVNVSGSKGEALLRYVNDLQLSHEQWWQAEGMTKNWFPHPASASSP